MKSVFLVLVCLMPLAGVGLAGEPITPESKLVLFNGEDLTGWTVTLEEPLPDVFSVREGVMHVAGMPFGYIRTEKAYTNYRLHLEWRWVDAPPAPGKKRNSGVFLHMTGEDKVWPNGIEAQLRAENAGFFIFLGNSASAEIQKLNKQEKAASDTSAAPKKQRPVRVMKRNPGVAEKPVGEWNSYDIVCVGDTITLTVNGKLANKASGCVPAAGKIGLQSEGAQLEFRNIYIEPVE